MRSPNAGTPSWREKSSASLESRSATLVRADFCFARMREREDRRSRLRSLVKSTDKGSASDELEKPWPV